MIKPKPIRLSDVINGLSTFSLSLDSKFNLNSSLKIRTITASYFLIILISQVKKTKRRKV